LPPYCASDLSQLVKSMLRDPIKHAVARTYGDVLRNHTPQMAAALSYYFVLSLFPSLIVLSAIVAYLPVTNLFEQAMSMMARFLPPDSMGLVRRVLSDVITPNRGTFLSFGILGTLWTASGGFAATIEALNIAYDVEDDRPFEEGVHVVCFDIHVPCASLASRRIVGFDIAILLLEEDLDCITAEDAKTGWKIVSFETDPFIPVRARLNVAD
jgi:YihY family inner membrane protein